MQISKGLADVIKLGSLRRHPGVSGKLLSGGQSGSERLWRSVARPAAQQNSAHPPCLRRPCQPAKQECSREQASSKPWFYGPGGQHNFPPPVADPPSLDLLMAGLASAGSQTAQCCGQRSLMRADTETSALYVACKGVQLTATHAARRPKVVSISSATFLRSAVLRARRRVAAMRVIALLR